MLPRSSDIPGVEVTLAEGTTLAGAECCLLTQLLVVAVDSRTAAGVISCVKRSHLSACCTLLFRDLRLSVFSLRFFASITLAM